MLYILTFAALLAILRSPTPRKYSHKEEMPSKQATYERSESPHQPFNKLSNN